MLPFFPVIEKIESEDAAIEGGIKIAVTRIAKHLVPALQSIGYDFELRLSKSTAYRIKPVCKYKEWTTTESRFSEITDTKGSGILGHVFPLAEPNKTVLAQPFIRTGLKVLPSPIFNLTAEVKQMETSLRIPAMLGVLSSFNVYGLIMLLNNEGGYSVKAPLFCVFEYKKTKPEDWALTYRNAKTRVLDRMYLKNTDLLLTNFVRLSSFKLELDLITRIWK